MRHILLVLLMALLASQAPAQQMGAADNDQVETEVSVEELVWVDDNAVDDEGDYNNYEDIDDDGQEEEEYFNEELPESELELHMESEMDGENCETSCPRYYRPLCVRRDDQLVTFATRCEYYNALRCAGVAQKSGEATPRYELLYQGACEAN